MRGCVLEGSEPDHSLKIKPSSAPIMPPLPRSRTLSATSLSRSFSSAVSSDSGRGVEEAL